MGADIHIRIIKRDHDTDTWKQIKLYRKEKKKFKVIDPYPFRNSELFDILNEREDDNYQAYPISLAHLPVALKKEIEKYQETQGYYDFKEINLADLKLYLRQVPKVRNWDYDDDHPKAWKDNPVKYFIERIESYIDFTEEDWAIPSSDIRILYWFDN